MYNKINFSPFFNFFFCVQDIHIGNINMLIIICLFRESNEKKKFNNSVQLKWTFKASLTQINVQCGWALYYLWLALPFSSLKNYVNWDTGASNLFCLMLFQKRITFIIYALLIILYVLPTGIGYSKNEVYVHKFHRGQIIRQWFLMKD